MLKHFVVPSYRFLNAKVCQTLIRSISFAEFAPLAKTPRRLSNSFILWPIVVNKISKPAIAGFILSLRRLRYIGNKSGMIESSNQINENEVTDESI